MTQLPVLAVVITIASGLLLLPATGHADTAARAGALAVLPARGTDQSALTLVTGSACPGGSNLLARITGKGFPAGGQNVVGNSPLTAYERTRTGGLRIPISLVLRDIGNLPSEPVRYEGAYQLTVVCRDRVRLPTLGTFSASLRFGSPHAFTTNNPAFALDVAPADTGVGSTAAPPQVTAPGPAGGTRVAPGTAATQAPGASGTAPARTAPTATPRVLAAATATGTNWLRWGGLVAVLLGALGLLGSFLNRRGRRTARS